MIFRELAPSLYGFTLGLKDFFLWWRSELLRSLPSVFVSWMGPRHPPTAVITVARDGCRIAEDPGPVPVAELSEKLRTLLAGGVIAGTHVRLHLAPDRYLRRLVSLRRLPISALRQAAELDVETETPFDSGEVQILVPVDQGSACAYYLVRRRMLAHLADQLRAAGLDAEELTAHGEESAVVRLPISGTPLRAGRRFKAGRVLAPLTLMATAAFLLFSWHQLQSKATAALVHLDAEIAQTEVEARKARRQYDAYVARVSQIEALRSGSLSGPRATVTWEELSRIVPDTSYLTNLTMKDESIEISGFSEASSELIPLIEDSDLFEAVQFLSPVVKVPGFDGDRFTISFVRSGTTR